MARVTGNSARVIGGHNLRKHLRLGAVSFVTTGTYDSRIQLWGSNRCGVLGVVGQRSVASLTRNHHVFAQFFLVYDFGVATLADLMSGKRDRLSRDLGDRISAIVTVLSETSGDDSGANEYKCRRGDDHDCGQPNEVFDVLDHSRLLARQSLVTHDVHDIFLYMVFRPENDDLCHRTL